MGTFDEKNFLFSENERLGSLGMGNVWSFRSYSNISQTKMKGKSENNKQTNAFRYTFIM